MYAVRIAWSLLCTFCARSMVWVFSEPEFETFSSTHWFYNNSVAMLLQTHNNTQNTKYRPVMNKSAHSTLLRWPIT